MGNRQRGTALLLAGFLWAMPSLHAQELPATPQPAPLSLGNTAAPGCSDFLQQSVKQIQQEQFPAAILSADAGLSKCPSDTTLQLAKARALMLSKQFDAAVQTLNAVLTVAPSDVEALILLGQVQYLSNHDTDAAAAFQKAITAAPDKPDPHYWMGRLAYEDGRIPQAKEQFEAAIKLDGGYFKAYDNLGLCYEALSDTPHAVQSYVKALSLVYKDHPEYDSVYLNLAALMLKQGANQRAFDLAAEAASRNPHNPRSFFLAGKALEQAGKADASLQWLNKAVAMDPVYPDPHYLLARVYREQGKDAEARAEVARFKELSDKAPKIRR